MKKTILLTALLAGAAMAETTTVSELVAYTNDVYISNVDHTISSTTTHGSESILVPNPTMTCNRDFNSNVGNVVQANIGKGAKFTTSFTFPVQLSGATYTIDNITLTYALHKEDGSTYKLSDYLADYAFENDLEDGTLAEYPQITFEATIKGKNMEGIDKVYQDAATIILSDTSLTKYSTGFNWEGIELYGEFELTVTVSTPDETLNDNNDFFLSMDTLRVTGEAPKSTNVPEPTTATLSLLALAGLAARRRRK